MDELIVVKQLPVIEEQLKLIKEQVEERVSQAMNLVCTEDTVKAVKSVRAGLNKEFSELEAKRKQVKSAIMSPYEQFEETYKDCVSDLYKKADKDLKEKIDSVESELKAKKAEAVKEYFEEYRESLNISPDLVGFADAGINVTLSASEKSLKDSAAKFLDKIADDLMLIDTQNHADEIMVEYRKSLNVSQAITSVTERYKALEREKAAREAMKAKEEEDRLNAEKVEQIIEFNAPAVEELPKEGPKEEIYSVTFTVYGNKAELKALKNFLVEGGFRYEQ